MEEKKKKSGRGGAREGAGRPKGDSKLITFRAPGYMANYIESHSNKTDYIRECIERDMNNNKLVAQNEVEDTYIDDFGIDINSVIEHTLDNIIVDSMPVNSSVSPNPMSSDDFPDIDGMGEVVKATDVASVNLPYSENQKVIGKDESLLDNVDLINLICPNKSSSYLIKVKGDSMKDANFYDGDIIVIDSGKRDPKDNQIALCELNGEYTMKYVRVHDGKGYLLPVNPNYSEWRITEDDHFCVWGIVTYVIHAPRNI